MSISSGSAVLPMRLAERSLSGKTTQETTQETTQKTREKTREKTSGKIVVLMKSYRGITIPELALEIGVTERSIERNIQKLQKEGIVQRIGPAKGGYWKIIKE